MLAASSLQGGQGALVADTLQVGIPYPAVPRGKKLPETIADRLRRYRTARRMTQEELAARSGVSRVTISDIERGVTNEPDVATLEKLSNGLNYPIDFFADPKLYPSDNRPAGSQEEIERAILASPLREEHKTAALVSIRAFFADMEDGRKPS